MTPQLCLLALTPLLICTSAMADWFVPFVIPAKPNPDSLIAYPASEPIKTSSDHLVVRSAHFYRSGQRVRLWGVNLSFGANMPGHEDAPHVAARLAAAGINAIRCHHMDTARWPRGLWNAKDGKTIAPEALDRLDFFIDQLARRGILVNINLHVGRAHSEYLGLPKTNRNYDKISNIFTPALIDAQKKYARDLLTHVNKYRKVRYADDPAVAIVEITNENSFFMWGSEQTLRTLPPYYANVLQGKFNAWLRRRYGSTAKLRTAWSEGAQPIGKSIVINGTFRKTTPGKNGPQNWQLEQHSGCKASLSSRRYGNQDSIRIDIAKADDTEWHLQFNQRDLALTKGQYYTVTFQAASGQPRHISCGVSQAYSPWQNLGLSKRADLTSEWKTFRFSFVAKNNEDNARLSFAFSGSNIPVYLANVEFRPGGRKDLLEVESLEAGNVVLFTESETDARTIDRMRFLADTEKDYFDDMRNYVKNDLGCKALVTGTIVFGPLGLYAQSDMDFIDAHAYWQHPRFPGRPWDSGNWLIDQKPMTDYPDQATLFRLAAQRLRGKPYTVSEYNHPAPLDSQAECVPMIASFAAAQDWDGVWLYTYSHSSDDWDRQTLNSYFDIDTNPAKCGFMRAGSVIFRHTGIFPLAAGLVATLNDTSHGSASLAESHLKHDRDILAAASEQTRISRTIMLQSRFFLSLASENTLVSETAPGQPPTQLTWSVEDGKGLYAVFGRSAWVLVGNADMFETTTRGHVTVEAPDFAALTVTALDHESLRQSRDVLVTACGRCENTGMKFSDDRRTVGRNWGRPPVQIEAVNATLTLRDGEWTCRALSPNGVRGDIVPLSEREDVPVLEISPKHKTMWYLLTRRTAVR